MSERPPPPSPPWFHLFHHHTHPPSLTLFPLHRYLTAANFTETLKAQQSTKLDTLKNVKAALVDDRALSFDDCIAWTRLNFEVRGWVG